MRVITKSLFSFSLFLQELKSKFYGSAQHCLDCDICTDLICLFRFYQQSEQRIKCSSCILHELLSFSHIIVTLFLSLCMYLNSTLRKLLIALFSVILMNWILFREETGLSCSSVLKVTFLSCSYQGSFVTVWYIIGPWWPCASTVSIFNRAQLMAFLGLMQILILGSKKIQFFDILTNIKSCSYQMLVTKINNRRQNILHFSKLYSKHWCT